MHDMNTERTNGCPYTLKGL